MHERCFFFFFFFSLCIFSQVRNIPERIILISTKSLRKMLKCYRKIYVGEDVVKESTCEKDLGVHIDNYLNFDVQRKEKIKKATHMMGVIRRTLKFLDCNMFNFNLLYKSMVRNYIESGVCLWYPYRIKDITQN